MSYQIVTTQRYTPQTLSEDDIIANIYNTDGILKVGNVTTALPLTFTKFSSHVGVVANVFPISILNGLLFNTNITVSSSNSSAIVLSANIGGLVGTSNDRGLYISGRYYKITNYNSVGLVANVASSANASGLADNIVFLPKHGTGQVATEILLYGYLGNGAVGNYNIANTTVSSKGNLITVDYRPIPYDFLPSSNIGFRIPVILERNALSNTGNVLGQLYFTESAVNHSEIGPRFVIQTATGTTLTPQFVANSLVQVMDNNFSYIN